MTFNCVKLGRAVTFKKYLLFGIKSYSSNSLNLAELMVNEPIKTIYNKFC